MAWVSRGRVFACVGIVLLAAAGAWALRSEVQTSRLQAGVIVPFARDLTFSVEPGLDPDGLFPIGGPYNKRLGYADIPSFITSLSDQGYGVEQQARLSENFRKFIRYGGFAVYREKSQTGLTIRDRDGDEIYTSRHPERVFKNFRDIPPLIVDSLLYIENRELLANAHPTNNPAVEWDRFAAASWNLLSQIVDPSQERFGGSTLAIQMEKYRHSPEGRTTNVLEKVRQIATASVRAYSYGADTGQARRNIVVDYVNSTPLAGSPGFGEIIGIGDGLWSWYGTNFRAATQILQAPPTTEIGKALRGIIYKQVVSLLLAQRRPSYYLANGRKDLEALTDVHLRLMAKAGAIDKELRDAALAADLVFRTEPPTREEISFVDRKAMNAIRTRLLSLIGAPSLYQLDRLDLQVDTSLDSATQHRVTEVLRQVTDPDDAAGLGLTGRRLVDTGNADELIYSVTLYERGKDVNYLRVQADNLDRPLDLNDGGKLDLGSTAKLRTLVSYLSVVAEVHEQHKDLGPEELRAAVAEAEDPLTRWVTSRMSEAPDRSLQGVLDAAMSRRYSASPYESFFTGGGRHTFHNFNRRDNARIMPVAEAFRRSTNLVFIRMMRDIVRYHRAQGPISPREVLNDRNHPARIVYLQRFADREGRQFLDRFLARYAGLSPEETLTRISERVRGSRHRQATLFRSVRPDADVTELRRFLEQRLPRAKLSNADVSRLYDQYGVEQFSLADRGYLARIHPLELWLAGYLFQHPNAKRSEIMAASTQARQDSYTWLFKKVGKRGANSRILTILEQDAFERIHASWSKVGYPFARLVPSLATALGTSADRPQALATLMGIIVNDGVRLPGVRLTRLHFAESTPYETVVTPEAERGVRVLRSEVAATLRAALTDVVEHGTARRLDGTYVGLDGSKLAVGGKTGTGDDLLERKNGKVTGIASARSAAFAFFIGDRFFGTITAHVPAEYARKHRFTSALPVQLLKALAPALKPLINGPTPPRRQQIPENALAEAGQSGG